MKPLREAVRGVEGLNALTCTVTDSAPGPEIVTVPVAEAAGAWSQSTLTQSRSSLVIVPRAALRIIQGSSTAARNSNGWSPRLNTSMYRSGRLNTSNSGNTAGWFVPGQAAEEPSMATPNNALVGSLSSWRAGISLAGGCCQPL